MRLTQRDEINSRVVKAAKSVVNCIARVSLHWLAKQGCRGATAGCLKAQLSVLLLLLPLLLLLLLLLSG
jgi:hypothetical protein